MLDEKFSIILDKNIKKYLIFFHDPMYFSNLTYKNWLKSTIKVERTLKIGKNKLQQK